RAASRGTRPPLVRLADPLAPLAHLAPQGHAGAHRARDESLLRVGHVALHEADRPPRLHGARRRDESPAPERPQEVDLQLEGGEALSFIKGRGVRRPHRGIGDIADDPAMERAHGIGVLWAGLKLEDRLPRFDRGRSKADESAHRSARPIPTHHRVEAIDQPGHDTSGGRAAISAPSVTSVRRHASTPASCSPSAYGEAMNSVAPASASRNNCSPIASWSPTMATSAGPAAPSRSSIAR